jgi:hypothetical protein
MSADSNKWWGSIVVVLFAEPELTSVPMRGRGLRPAPFKPGGDYFQKPRIH